jgi:hypothetical protein
MSSSVSICIQQACAAAAYLLIITLQVLQGKHGLKCGATQAIPASQTMQADSHAMSRAMQYIGPGD